jgi:hypothetical protein
MPSQEKFRIAWFRYVLYCGIIVAMAWEKHFQAKKG